MYALLRMKTFKRHCTTEVNYCSVDVGVELSKVIIKFKEHRILTRHVSGHSTDMLLVKVKYLT